ncbi:hypothetical protein LR007_00915 [candidate division NPL-UPA2 bacterium]|nr:hypothetical protein [candidate division NPL-UPA2 bacterium]
MTFSRIHLPSFIYLYDGGQARTLSLTEIEQYLRTKLRKTQIKIRDDFITHYLSRVSEEGRARAVEGLARAIAFTKVQDLENPKAPSEPAYGEIEYEKRRIMRRESKSFGILYHAFRLQTVFSSLLLGEELSDDQIHIIFTNQLFGTWDENDRRFHARVSVYGIPSLISTTGIVEAPAKPREFYLLKQQYGLSGGDNLTIQKLKEKFKGRFIDYEDERLTEIMKGYVLQAIFFQALGEPFCDHKGCRLYNAHWQEEVIEAQLGAQYEFCKKHEKILMEL